MKTTLIREVALTYKRKTETPTNKIINSESAEKILRPLYEDMDIYESFIVLYLNNNNKVIGWQKTFTRRIGRLYS